MSELMRLFAEAVKFARSPAALRGRAAYARQRWRDLTDKAEALAREAMNEDRPKRRGRLCRRVDRKANRAQWWHDRAVELERRAEERSHAPH